MKNRFFASVEWKPASCAVPSDDFKLVYRHSSAQPVWLARLHDDGIWRDPEGTHLSYVELWADRPIPFPRQPGQQV